MKLEPKHLTPYLPYNLKCEILDYKCDYVGEQYGTIKGYYFIGDDVYYTFKASRDYAGKNTNSFKPILRPISDLTKDEFSGKIIEEYEMLDYEKQIISIIEDIRWVNQCDYLLIQLLIENHFDVFGLIDKGLAININDIK